MHRYLPSTLYRYMEQSSRQIIQTHYTHMNGNAQVQSSYPTLHRAKHIPQKLNQLLSSHKDMDTSRSYRPISLLSVTEKILEKSHLSCITTNIPNTSMHHEYKIQHSTVTALHTVNNTVAKRFNQMALMREQSL